MFLNIQLDFSIFIYIKTIKARLEIPKDLLNGKTTILVKNRVRKFSVLPSTAAISIAVTIIAKW